MTCSGCRTSAQLEEILLQLRELRAIIEPRRCSPADLDALKRLLPAIAGRWGSGPVTVAEILTNAAIRALWTGSRGSLGSLLSRAAADGANADGYAVSRLSREHGAALWGVYRLPEGMDGTRQRRDIGPVTIRKEF